MPHLSKDQIEALPTLELEAVVNSTNPDGRYGQEFVLARDELARRLLNGLNYKDEARRNFADKLDNKRLSGAFDVLIKEIRTGERDLEQAINQRDAAEECLSQMYYLATGRSPEWSNKFDHSDALEDVGDALVSLKSALQEAIDNFEGMNDDEINLELLPRLRAALSGSEG